MNISRKEWVLIGCTAMLLGLYVVRFTNWFRPEVIRIESTVRPLREAWAGNGQRMNPPANAGNVTFKLQKGFRLTAVEVVPAVQLETNQTPHPLWRLVAKSGSEPVNGFAYGMPIPGMRAESGDDPAPLQPDVEYRLLVQAGSVKGTNNFRITR